MSEHRLPYEMRRHGYKSPGRRASRGKDRVWWPSIWTDENKQDHRRMYVHNPVKYVWTRLPTRFTEAPDLQDKLIQGMVETQEKYRSEGYLDG